VSTRKEFDGRRVGEHFNGDLRRALIDAAVDALNDSGADNLSLRDVARRIGVSHAAPAHHFGDKVGLLTAVATEGFELFIDHLAAAVALVAGDAPERQLPAMGRAYAEFAERHPGHFDVMFRPGLTRPDDPDYVRASDGAFEALQYYVAQCQQAGWRPDADTRALAAASWALAHGISVLRAQGSLQRHYPDPSLDGVAVLTATLVSTGPGSAARKRPRRAR
jgi:AcrR family transcriptional regulator